MNTKLQNQKSQYLPPIVVCVLDNWLKGPGLRANFGSK